MLLQYSTAGERYHANARFFEYGAAVPLLLLLLLPLRVLRAISRVRFAHVFPAAKAFLHRACPRLPGAAVLHAAGDTYAPSEVFLGLPHWQELERSLCLLLLRVRGGKRRVCRGEY